MVDWQLRCHHPVISGERTFSPLFVCPLLIEFRRWTACDRDGDFLGIPQGITLVSSAHLCYRDVHQLPVFCLTSESELGIRGLMDLMGAFPHKLDLLLAAPIRMRGAIGSPPAIMAHQFVYIPARERWWDFKSKALFTLVKAWRSSLLQSTAVVASSSLRSDSAPPPNLT